MFLAGTSNTGFEWLDQLVNAVYRIINPILIVAAVAGLIYSIIIGIRFVKADNKEQREDAKKKLIYTLIGIVVTFVMIALFYWLAYAFSHNLIDLQSLLG